MNEKSRRVVATSFLVGLCQLTTAAHATAVGGFDIGDTFNFIDARQPNSAGLAVGTRISFGVDLTGASAANAVGTTVTAQQDSFSIGVPFLFSPALPGEFFNSIDFPTHSTLTGAWDLEISNPGVNGGTATVLSTAALATTTPPPFVTDVNLSGGGLTPTINWSVPGGFVPSDQLVSIFDVTHKTPNGFSTLTFRSFPSPTDTSFTIPAGVLQADTHYSFAVQLEQRSTPANSLDLGLQGKSRSFVSFDTLPAGSTGQVFLPVVGEDTNAGDNLGAPFIFDFGVTQGTPFAIDPQLATGYEYMIGTGDPLFASVMLPDIGDTDGYLLCLWNGSAYDRCLTHLDPLTTFTFAGDGTDRFKVLDIDPGLDPLDTTAFVTTLTFAGDGRFTGTMTPILKTVPEPGTIALLSIALSMMFAARRRSELAAG